VFRGEACAVLRFAARESDGVGFELAGGVPPNGPGAAGISYTRRKDKHSVPRECRQSSEVSKRPGHDGLSRSIAGAISICQPCGPGDKASLVSWGCDS